MVGLDQLALRMRAARGALLVELALVLPLLLLIFFIGVLELGRLFSQVSWLANASYIAVATGGEAQPGARGQAVMTAKFDQLVSLQGLALDNDPARAPRYRTAEDLVELDVSASVKTLGPLMHLPLAMKFVGPMLVLDPTSAGNLNTYENPTCLYTCTGVRTSCCAPYVGCGGWTCASPALVPVPPKHLVDMSAPVLLFPRLRDLIDIHDIDTLPDIVVTIPPP